MKGVILGPAEFFNEFAGRKFGKFRALVKDTSDPKQLGRVRVYLPSVYGRSLSPWVEPCFPPGLDSESGWISIPHKDSYVFIEFEGGKTTDPIYVGSYVDLSDRGKPDEKSPISKAKAYLLDTNPIPSHAKGVGDSSDADSLKGTAGVPKSNFKGKYPYVRVFKSPGGQLVEIDDTPGNERIQLCHKTGSHIEILPDGTVHIISSGNLRTRSDTRVSHVFGYSHSYVSGNDIHTVTGNKDQVVSGDMISVAKKTVSIDFGPTSVKLASLSSTVEGDIDIEAGSLSIKASKYLGLLTSMDLSAQSIGTVKVLANNAKGLSVLEDALTLVGRNGRAVLSATSLDGSLGKYGVVVQPLNATTGAAVATTGNLGPLVHLGKLLQLLPDGAPLTQENSVMGKQLILYLTSLHTFLSTWLTDYLIHAHPPFSPSYTAAAMATQLPPLLQASAAYMTPAGPKATPLLLSDVVFLSKT